jgi:hypothetical protein
MMGGTEFGRRQAEVERLLDELRRLVREGRELEQEAAGTAALDANREKTERLRLRLANVVKSTLPRRISGEGLARVA